MEKQTLKDRLQAKIKNQKTDILKTSAKLIIGLETQGAAVNFVLIMNELEERLTAEEFADFEDQVVKFV